MRFVVAVLVGYVLAAQPLDQQSARPEADACVPRCDEDGTSCYSENCGERVCAGYCPAVDLLARPICCWWHQPKRRKCVTTYSCTCGASKPPTVSYGECG